MLKRERKINLGTATLWFSNTARRLILKGSKHPDIHFTTISYSYIKRGHPISDVGKTFRKTNISNPLIRTHMSEMLIFSENIAYAPEGWWWTAAFEIHHKLAHSSHAAIDLSVRAYYIFKQLLLSRWHHFVWRKTAAIPPFSNLCFCGWFYFIKDYGFVSK